MTITLAPGPNFAGNESNATVETIVSLAFLINKVVRDDNVLMNTWDLSRVRLVRASLKMTFDLTANPPPDVWLENGDVIEIPDH